MVAATRVRGIECQNSTLKSPWAVIRLSTRGSVEMTGVFTRREKLSPGLAVSVDGRRERVVAAGLEGQRI